MADSNNTNGGAGSNSPQNNGPSNLADGAAPAATAATPPSTPAPAAAQATPQRTAGPQKDQVRQMYVLTSGKHRFRDDKGDWQMAKVGDEVPLTRREYDLLRSRFKPVADAAAEAAPAAPAAEAAPAPAKS